MSPYRVGDEESRQNILQNDENQREGEGEDLGIDSNLANRVKSSTGFVGNASDTSFETTSFETTSSETLFPSVDSNAPFMREHIPSEQTHPILYRHLTSLWYERQEAVRGMGDALAEDNADKFCALQRKAEYLNKAMHEELRTCKIVDPSLDRACSVSSSQSSRSSDTRSSQSSHSSDRTRSSRSSSLEKRGAESTDECPGRARAYTVSAAAREAQVRTR